MNTLNILQLIQALLGAAETIVPIFVHNGNNTTAVVVTTPTGAAQLHNVQSNNNSSQTN